LMITRRSRFHVPDGVVWLRRRRVRSDPVTPASTRATCNGFAALRSNTACWPSPPHIRTPGEPSKNASSRDCKASVRRTRMPPWENELTNQRHQPAQNPHRTRCRCNIAGTQHRRAQILIGLVVESDKAHHRQVTCVVVVAVEKRQTLAARAWDRRWDPDRW